MNVIHIGMLAASLAASAGLAGTKWSAERFSGTKPAAEEVQRYKVLLTGRDTGCAIERGPETTSGVAELALGASCALAPGFQGLQYWLEDDDGSVLLADPQGEVRLRFAAADGAAYESFGAGVPLMALIALE